MLKLSNQEKIKFDHQKRIFRIFAEGGCYSCTDIAKTMNLSNTAVANIIDIFLKKQLILLREMTMQNEMGRPSIMYELNPNYGLVASIDLTDEELIVCVSNTRMEILGRKSIPHTIYITQSIIESIIDYLREFLKQNNFSKYNYICIGTPGKIDHSTGNFSYAPKFQDYKTVNLHDIFVTALSCPVMIKNDIKLALQGESFYGCCRHEDDVIFLHLDHNYGGAIALNGKILEGSHGYAGEFGSVRAQNRDENFRYISYNISIGGMIFNYDELCRKHELPICSPSIEKFIELCKSNDPLAVQVLKQAAEHTAIEINNLCTILDCNFVVINGRARHFGSEYISLIQKCLSNYIYDSSTIRVCFTSLDGRATILGGLRCAIENYTFSLLDIS